VDHNSLLNLVVPGNIIVVEDVRFCIRLKDLKQFRSDPSKELIKARHLKVIELFFEPSIGVIFIRVLIVTVHIISDDFGGLGFCLPLLLTCSSLSVIVVRGIAALIDCGQRPNIFSPSSYLLLRSLS
jgi:hypothetical protein